MGIENKVEKYIITDKVSFETSLKCAFLTGLIKNGDRIEKDGLFYTINLSILAQDKKIGIELIPYKQAS
mgnify:CR=1 FL=1